MNSNSESGFSYVDVMVALIIMTVGVLAFMSAITGAVVFSNTQEEQLKAKQLVSSTMESVISTKETNVQRLGWTKVGNIGKNPDANGVNQGIFLNGVQPVKTDPGTDQVMGTADDKGDTITGFTREIIIKDQCDPDRPSPICPTPGNFATKIRSIQVRVFYFVGRFQQEENLTTVLTEY